MYIRILLQIMYTCFSQNLIGVKNKRILKKKYFKTKNYIYIFEKLFYHVFRQLTRFLFCNFWPRFQVEDIWVSFIGQSWKYIRGWFSGRHLVFFKKKRNFKVHWRVILNNESNNRSHIMGSFGSVCPLPYHIR